MTPDPARARRYLLGETTEADGETLEREYFAGGPALEIVVEAEETLIDDFLAGRLSGDERRRFESHYLARPANRRRVAVTRALRDRARPRRSAWSTPLLSLAAVLAVAVLGGLLWQRGGMPGTGSSVGVTLPAVLLRDGGSIPEARIGKGVRTVVLRFEAGPVPVTPPLEAVVRSVEGVEVWRGPAEPIDGPPGATPRLAASVEVPASALSPGDYVVALLNRDAGGVRELQRAALRVVER